MTVTEASVRKSVEVAAPVEKAFRVFTEGFDMWWSRDHHIGEAELKEAVLEGRPGGRWYERGVDGSECEWGKVLVWEPPHRLVLAWQIGAQWHFDADLVTEVEVRFDPVGPDRTRVELEHRDLDRYGDTQEQMRASLDSEGGWQGLLEAFARAAG
jgi:uncharacterized protein YndB with AHSA1/START domain